MRHDTEAFEMRMQRNFPNTFINLLDKTSLHYYVVNMDGLLTETVGKFQKIIA